MDEKLDSFPPGSDHQREAPERLPNPQLYHQTNNYGLTLPDHQTLPTNQRHPISPHEPPSFSTNQSAFDTRPPDYEARDVVVDTGSSYQNQNAFNPNENIPPPLEAPVPVQHYQSAISPQQKSIFEAYLLALVFGLAGGHHFYLHRYGWGALYFFTVGLLGFGVIIDLFRVPYLVRKYNKEITSSNPAFEEKRKDLSDAYVLWFPFGLVGFHHYYLGNVLIGIVYTFTLGIFGLGWLVDAFRMPSLVKNANAKIQQDRHVMRDEKNLVVCYLLALPPFGWIGLHHFYMNRIYFGIVYILTLGLLGFGWFVDLFRMPVLLRRCNDELRRTRKPFIRTVDDCYVLWFPFGLIGYHHFYLGRYVWGILYHLTFGIFGLGWFLDAFRIPRLVKEANQRREEMIEERRRLIIATADATQQGPCTYPEKYTNQHTQQPVHCQASAPNDENYGFGSNQDANNSNDVMVIPGDRSNLQYHDEGNETSLFPDERPPGYTEYDNNMPPPYEK